MTRLTKDLLIAASAEISYKKLFFNALHQYVSYKFYIFAIMKALIMLKHYDIRENILELFHANLKEDNISFSKDLLYEQEKRKQAIKNATRRQYINDNENVDLNIAVNLIFIYLN